MTHPYNQIKQRLIDELTHSALAHEAGDIWNIDGSYNELEGQILIGDHGPEFDKFVIALEFWSGWIDARNHEWKYYEGIEPSDWPHLARSIANNLSADRETDDERIKVHFDYRNRRHQKGILQRLTEFFGFRNASE